MGAQVEDVPVFSIVGDSNVRTHMNPTNVRDRPLMSAAQVIFCTKLAVFVQSMRSIKPEATVCILSCITNFLTDSSDSSSSAALRVGQAMDDFFARVVEFCTAHPGRRFFICPPMYRTTPLWYRDGLSEILTRFSASYASAAVKAKNLHAMPGFPSPSLEKDGVHLTAYSGLEFVLHLFDSAKILLTTLSSSTVREGHTCESTRSLGDRMIAIEQDHKRLVSAFDLKYAIDAELACFRTNERNEDSFIITGLNRLRDGLSGREWQAAAQVEVRRVLSLLSLDGLVPKIIVVHNVTGRSPGAPASFSVKLDSVSDSRLIRSKFSSFFSGGSDSRPENLKNITIRNVLTKETRIRLSIMKALGQRYKDSNAGSKFQVPYCGRYIY
jgi:hypothetical protein